MTEAEQYLDQIYTGIVTVLVLYMAWLPLKFMFALLRRVFLLSYKSSRHPID